MERITRDDLPGLFGAVAQVMAEQARTLCEMDARMGDGDLGLTMKRGFAALPEALRASDEPDLGKRIAAAAIKMAGIAPSTMGTLMASGLMRGGMALTGTAEIGPTELSVFLTAFAEGIAKRGKCARGERTVLDAVGPAADRAAALLLKTPGAALPAVAGAALEGARCGVESTKVMVPKYGKAAVFAGQTDGVPDQGAYAGLCFLEGLSRWISGAESSGASPA